MYTAFSPLTRNHTQKPSRRGRGEGTKRTADGGPFCCVCFRREKMHRVGRTLCLMIQYPIIFTELCVSCEQFVNDPHQRHFSRKGRNIFQNPADFSEKSPNFSTNADSLWNHFSRFHPGRKRPHPLPQPGKISLPGCFRARNAAKQDRKYGYLYFRLSATAISSQRLLNSFSAWPLTQW